VDTDGVTKLSSTVRPALANEQSNTGKKARQFALVFHPFEIVWTKKFTTIL
jgi:hypothetical protein